MGFPCSFAAMLQKIQPVFLPIFSLAADIFEVLSDSDEVAVVYEGRNNPSCLDSSSSSLGLRGGLRGGLRVGRLLFRKCVIYLTLDDHVDNVRVTHHASRHLTFKQ